MGPWLALHNLEVPTAMLLAPVGQVLASVVRIGQDFLEPRHEWREPRQELAGARWVRQVGRGDVDGHVQTEGIDQEMSFTTLDTFMSVVSADAG
jgi:hypothetical protein